MTTTQAALLEALKAVEPYLDSIVCYASTVAEHPPNALPAKVRAAIAQAETAALSAADAAQPEPVASAAVLLAEQVLHMDMVTERGRRARELARQVLNTAHDVHEGECAAVLRSLASYLGAGGYNAPAVDPETFHQKILWGINELRGTTTPQPAPIAAQAVSDPVMTRDELVSAAESIGMRFPVAAQADILAALMTCRAALRVLSEATDRDVRPGIWTMAGGWDALDKADHVMTMVKNHPPQLKPNTPSDARALAAMMQAAAGDPMWADHAEVNKATLQRAANALLFMAGQVECLAACVDPAAFEEARPETAAEAVQRMAQEARDAADANWCAQQRSKEQ